MKDLLFLSLEDWDEIWRRNQFICATLARRHPDMRIVFVGVPRHAANHVRSRRIGPLFSDPSFVPAGFPNIFVTRPLRLAPESYEWGLRLNQRLYRRHLTHAINRFKLRDPILWINPHNAFHVTKELPRSTVIYDITDDWTSIDQSELDKRRTIDADRLLCEQADAVIVCSERLREMKRPLVDADRLHLIPNGVDASHYAAVQHRSGPGPGGMEKFERPVYGYTGTIHPDRIDLQLLVSTANLLTRGSLILIGPSHLKPEEAARLVATGKIHLLPAVPYSRIPEYMRMFDVSMTPHRVTPFTESLNPIKLWEYLAAGKPIVSTDVAGFRDYPQFVHIASGAAEFASALERAARETEGPDGASIAAMRQVEAQKHSWESRVDCIEAVIDACRNPRNFAAGTINSNVDRQDSAFQTDLESCHLDRTR